MISGGGHPNGRSDETAGVLEEPLEMDGPSKRPLPEPIPEIVDQVLELGDPGTPVARLVRGDRVDVQMIWGHEHGVVQRVVRGALAFPVAEVLLVNGDLVSINVARCTREAP